MLNAPTLHLIAALVIPCLLPALALAEAGPLQRGDLAIASSSLGGVVRVDPTSGDQTTLSVREDPIAAFGIAIEPDGTAELEAPTAPDTATDAAPADASPSVQDSETEETQ